MEEEVKSENQTETEEVKEEATQKEPEKKDKKEKKKSELDLLKEKVETLEKEAAEQKDKYLRLAAEYDNFRKRSAKEREGTYTDAVSDTINEMLPVIDNLERAALYKDAEKVSEGLAITAKGAKAMLSKLGITDFCEVGDKFDPNIHNAVMHIEDDEQGEGVIVEVFQRGYKKGDKIIRFAMVKVAN